MIPDLQLDSIHIGPVRLHPFGVLLTAGVIAAHTVLVRRARGLASSGVVEGFAVTLGAGGLVAALAAEKLGAGGISSALAAAGAAAAGAGYAAAFGLPMRRFADAAAEAFPYGWILARGGCALVHDHLGPPSRSWLAVALPSGPRLDLGLAEWLLTPLLFAAVALGRRRGAGGAAGALAVAYGAIRLPLDTLRTDDARYASLTGAQWASLVLLAIGAALLASPVKATP